MKTILTYFAAGCVSAALGVGIAGAIAFSSMNHKTFELTSEEKKEIRAAMPINIDDYADGCENPTFQFFTKNVIEEHEYDCLACVLYSDEEVEDIGECEIFLDWDSYEAVMESIKTGNHTSGTIVPVDETDLEIRIYKYIPNEK